MLFFKDKRYSRDWFISYSLIFRGALVSSLGYAFFIIPHKIIPGGFFGITVILHHLFSLPVGVLLLVFNVPLFLWGIRLLGPKFGAKSLWGVVLTSLFTDLFSYLNKGRPLSQDILVSTVFGSILAGVGMAWIFKARATTGGTDILAQILNRKYKLSFGHTLMVTNFMVIASGMIVFASIELGVYAVIATYVSARVIDLIMDGYSYFKGVMIVSDRYLEIKKNIIEELKSGGTLFSGSGLYSDEQRRIIFTVINRRGLAYLTDYIKAIDPSSFVVVFNTQDVYGLNFKKFGDDD